MAKIGKMRHELTLQDKIETRDSGGGFVSGWQDVIAQPQLWAEIMPLRNEVSIQAGGRETKAYYRIKTRFRSDIVPGQRLFEVARNRYFLIESVSDLNQRQAFLMITAAEL